MSKTLLALMLSAAAVIGGCASQNSQVQDEVVELTPPAFRQVWSRNLHMAGEHPREMHLVDQSLFVYATDNKLYRLDRNSGDVIFISDVARPGTAVKPPLVQDSAIIVPTDTKLEFLDQRGFPEKTIDLKSPIRTGVVGVGGIGGSLYVGVVAHDGGGRILAVDPSRPFSPNRWELHVGPTGSTPAYARSILFAGGDEGKLYAVNPDRGVSWPLEEGVFKTGGRIIADIITDDRAVYVASGDTKLYALDINTGKILWQYHAGVALDETPVVTDSRVYVHVNGRGVASLDKTQGDFNRQPLWMVPEATGFLAETQQHVLLKDRRGYILAVNHGTGQVEFRSQGRYVAFAVNPEDGRVFAATKDGTILSIEAVTRQGSVGAVAWIDLGAAGRL